VPPTPPDKPAGFLIFMGMSDDALSLGGVVRLDLTEQEVRIVRAFIERIKADRDKPPKTPSLS